MKKSTLLFSLFLLLFPFKICASLPDSVYLFSYSTVINSGRNGLHFAWSGDGECWQEIGPEHSFLKSDFGRWGAEKRMLTPILLPLDNGEWVSLFSFNETVNAFAVAFSKDLVNWRPQNYHYLPSGPCFDLTVSALSAAQGYRITYRNGKDFYSFTTSDFKTFSSPEPTALYVCLRDTVELSSRRATGTICRVDRSVVDYMIKSFESDRYHASLYRETTADDALRFKDLESVEASLVLHPEKEKAVSDKLIGIFFEDINYSADGGLYAELVQNRDFEYSSRDNNRWDALTAWKAEGEVACRIDTAAPIHPNNPHYAVLTSSRAGEGMFENMGYDGMVIREGDKYILSLFAKSLSGKGAKLQVCLVSPEGTILADKLFSLSDKWKKQTALLTAKTGHENASLRIIPHTTGSVALDMVSLFPKKTFKNRTNGLRADLAQALADLHPRFVRFPGGCVAHGNGLDNIYRWKNTIGPLEARKPDFNLWGYHQTMGFGFYEYFQFCEDIGAHPLPIIAAGVPCQNSSEGGDGQQGGMPMDQMDEYIQDILDLVEWANGSKNSKWGRLRAEAGHPEPFGLKYIGIGNEDLITDIFKERFEMIFDALRKKHPEITVIGTVGPFYKGADYEEGWDFATRLGVPIVDEHYYESPGWFVHNRNYYDAYDRKGPKVYLGEYAAHLPGRPNNMETALSEALYITDIERNGDVVEMLSYAPLLAKEGHTQWNPDLIYFNNTEVKPTAGYYVQQMFGQNSGDTYLPATLKYDRLSSDVVLRIGTSVVCDDHTGDLIVKVVNLLPVQTTLQMDFIGETAALRETLLSGMPQDRNVSSVTRDVAASADGKYLFPPYSFTVLRVKGWRSQP